MGIVQWFKDRMAPAKASKAIAPASNGRPHAAPDPRGAPGTRVYHEYFVTQCVDGVRYEWHCRVYSQNAEVTEHRGIADTEQAARSTALWFAARTKLALRGEA